jgi:hypothetical protein
MQDIDGTSKADGLDRPISVAIEVIDHFKDTSATKALKRFGGGVLFSVLGVVDGKTHDAANLGREFAHVVLG